MKGEDVVIGKEYVLSTDYEYWCIELQRRIKISGGQDMIVKVEHTHNNKVFFGRLIDSQGELEFGPDAIIREYTQEDYENSKPPVLLLNWFDLYAEPESI